MESRRRHPPWLKVRAPTGVDFFATKRVVKLWRLHTVCEEAHCPNIGECWSHGTATFMLLGDVCTRNCNFCAVRHGKPPAVDPTEPERVARAVAALELKHVVVTSVNRDDLADGGASQFARTVLAIKALRPESTVEVLVPDFRGNWAALQRLLDTPVDVLNHNVETVPRLYRSVRPGARYERSLALLAKAKSYRADVRTKTGLMLGLGENFEELASVFRDLVNVGCDILTLGQYLRPTSSHLPVVRYVPPEEFQSLRTQALSIGFRHVEAGPLVRSSYHAWKHLG